MPFEFLKQNLAQALLLQARMTFLSSQFYSPRINGDEDMCCYLAGVMCLLENCAASMLPSLNPKYANFDYSTKLREQMTVCADEFQISAPLEKVALQELEREYLLNLAIKTRKDGSFTYNDVFASPRPYSEIFRLVQVPRAAQFARMIERAQRSGFESPRDSVAVTMSIAPLWLFGCTEPNAEAKAFSKSVISSLVSIVHDECLRF